MSKTKEEQQAYRRVYYAAHRKSTRKRNRSWRTATPEQVELWKVEDVEQKPKTNRIYYETHRGQFRTRREKEIMRLYGLGHDVYGALLETQGYQCAICSKPLTVGRKNGPQVDHDHSSRDVRGILCGSCNYGLGCFGDSPERLESALNYLASPPIGRLRTLQVVA